MSEPSDEPQKLDSTEVFQVLGASDTIGPTALGKTSREVGASPEIVQFMEQLPGDVHEPADVVAAAANAGSNPAGMEMELPAAEPTPTESAELTIDEITGQ